MYLDGSTVIGALDGVIRDRLRMALYGHVIVTVILDEEDEMIGEPWCEVRWPEMYPQCALCRCAGRGPKPIYRRADYKTITNDDKPEEAIKRIARQTRQTVPVKTRSVITPRLM